MQDLGKMHLQMEQWEEAQNHLQIIFNLKSVHDLKWFVAQIFCLLELLVFTDSVFLQIVFLGIDNIHAMRDSFSRLRDYLDMHGTTSSDGTSSFLVSTEFQEILKKSTRSSLRNAFRWFQ